MTLRTYVFRPAWPMRTSSILILGELDLFLLMGFLTVVCMKSIRRPSH